VLDRVVVGVVGAADDEAAQGGEVALDSVEPGAVGREEHELGVVVGQPRLDSGGGVGREVVDDAVEALVEWVEAAQLGEEVEEVGAGAAAAVEAVQQIVFEVVAAEQVSDPLCAPVGRPQPLGLALGCPADARLRLYLDRAELVDAKPAAAAWTTAVEAKNSPFLRSNSGSVDCFQVLVRWNEMPRSISTWRTPSCEIDSITPLSIRWSRSFGSDQCVNGNPRSRGRESATATIRSRVCSSIRRGLPGERPGRNAANPRSLKSFRTARIWPASKKIVPVISGTDIPCAEQSTTAARRATTESRERRASRCNSRPSASEIGRTNTIGNLQSETVAGRFEISDPVPASQQRLHSLKGH
jgi:hypothetical protein